MTFDERTYVSLNFSRTALLERTITCVSLDFPRTGSWERTDVRVWWLSSDCAAERLQIGVYKGFAPSVFFLNRCQLLLACLWVVFLTWQNAWARCFITRILYILLTDFALFVAQWWLCVLCRTVMTYVNGISAVMEYARMYFSYITRLVITLSLPSMTIREKFSSFWQVFFRDSSLISSTGREKTCPHGFWLGVDKFSSFFIRR